MQLDRLRVTRHSIPLPSSVSDSTHGTIRTFSLVTVRAEAGSSLEGLGYTYTVGESAASSIHALIEDDLAPLLAGRDPRCTEKAWRLMWRATHYAGRGGPASFAISAVDMALWDLKAKALGEPLWRLLGGSSPRVEAYASGIDLDQTPDELADRTRARMAAGFRAFKMKIGRDRLSEDVERVSAVREVIGPDVPLMVDANMKWTVAEALRASRALAAFDPLWLEEPIEPGDIEGHIRIQREGPVPVAAGENLHTISEFTAMISGGAVAYPQPDVTNCGGITSWIKVAHLAEAHGLPVTTHGAHDVHVGLLAAVPNASFLEIHGFGLDDFVRRPLSISNGAATASDRPGHGVEFDWELLRAYQVDR